MEQITGRPERSPMHLLAVLPGAKHFTSPCLSFLICTMGVTCCHELAGRIRREKIQKYGAWYWAL